MTYITKIMLSGIDMVNTEYFDNTNDYYLKKIERLCQDHIRIYHFVPWCFMNEFCELMALTCNIFT